jgi:hypothetical protein
MRRRYHARRLNFDRRRAESAGMGRWLLVIAIVLTLAYCFWGGGAIARPAGVLAPDDPVQENLADGPHWQLAGYDIHALARFELDARVLAASHYHLDRESSLAPVDLALGWGPMSDTAVLDALSISQGARFYSYSWSSAPPIRPGEIGRHSANMHMIPEDETVRATLLAARPGNLVHLKGWLIEAKAADGWHWRSSLSRGDTGGGACEVVLVEALSLE